MIEKDSNIEDDATSEDNSIVLDSLFAAALEADIEGNIVSHIRGKRAALTAEELSGLLSLSHKHIYKMAKSGRMPSYRIGGAIRFDPRATADWLDNTFLSKTK